MSTFASCSRLLAISSKEMAAVTKWHGGERTLSPEFLELMLETLKKTSVTSRGVILGFSAVLRSHHWAWTHYAEQVSYGLEAVNTRSADLTAVDCSSPDGGAGGRCKVIHSHLVHLLNYTLHHYKEYSIFPRPRGSSSKLNCLGSLYSPLILKLPGIALVFWISRS